MNKKSSIYLLLILVLHCCLYAQKNVDVSDSIKLTVFRVYGIMTLPFYTSFRIDKEEVVKLESGTYISLTLERKKHIISIAKRDPIIIDSKSDEYYFAIIFRKRLFWRKQDLIQVTKEYFDSLDLSEYREINKDQKTKKWY